MFHASAVILPLDAGADDLARVGGKAANLARLVRAGFAVPGGFVLTTTAYAAFVSANRLQPFIVAPASAGASDDPVALERTSQTIRARFVTGRVPTDLDADLRSAHARLGAPPVAVRSSATAEDLPEMSFAGQQDTYLNVVGPDALIAAVVKCWASLWTARAIGYRARNGIAAEAVSMAVIVQTMVRAEASGVLFTANPLSGKRTEMVIDAGLGLGEALVSGQIEPDRYVTTPDGRILDTRLGSKTVSIRPRAGGGTETLDEDAGTRQALPDSVITELARLGARVATLSGEPQDIEWAWDGRRLSLLQTRAITSLYPLPEGMPLEPSRILFSFGAVQGLLDPMTPLGRHAIRALAAGASRLFGFDYTPDTQPALRTAGERLFIDVSPLMRHPVGARLLPRVLSLIEPATAHLLASMSGDPRLRTRPGATLWSTLPRFARLLINVLPRLCLALLRPDASRAALRRAIDAPLASVRTRCAAATTLAARLALVEEILTRTPPFVITTFLPRVAGGLGSLNALRLLTSGLPGAPDAMEATRGLPHNVTTEMDLALWQVACAIRDAGADARFAGAEARTLAAECLARRLPDGVQGPVDDFLERYGMRGVAEIDLGRARWRDDPTPIMQVLQSYLQIDDSEQAPEQRFATGAVAAEAALARLADAAGRTRGGWLKRPLVRWLGRRVRALAGLRESPKFYVIRLFGMVRAALLASGRELSDRGVLARADDIFYLDLPELKAFGSGKQRDWPALVASRRARHARERRRRQVPRLMFSDGQAFYEGLGAESGARELTGSPVSPGTAEGIVHVLLDPHGARLAPGEILVCPATDPGWTPLFLAAGGLVMEVGGLMTHGAVVAREYGIPAIVGVHEVTTRLRSGQRVRVDGSTGRVVLLEE